MGGNLITAGAFATTLTSTATTNATLPAGTNTLYSTKAASISSAQLLASLTDPTGTGVAVFSTSPVLTTPTLGVASSTSSTITGTGGVGYLELQSQSSAPATGQTNSVRLFSNAGGLSWKRSDGFVRSFASTLTADRTYTLPDANGTMAVSASGNIALSAAGNITFTGTLPIANGGTNSTATPTNGGIVYGDGSSMKVSAAGTSGQLLQSAGAASPVWVDGGTLMLAGVSNNSAVNNTTLFFPITGAIAGSATDAQAGIRTLVSRAGTVKGLYVKLSAALASGKTGTVTVYKNGVATALVVTLSVGPVDFNNTSNSFTVAAGDEIGVQISTTGNVKFSWAANFTY